MAAICPYLQVLATCAAISASREGASRFEPPTPPGTGRLDLTHRARRGGRVGERGEHEAGEQRGEERLAERGVGVHRTRVFDLKSLERKVGVERN